MNISKDKDIDKDIPKYLINKISLNIVPFDKSKKIICCDTFIGMTNKIEVQKIINSYKHPIYSNKIVYIFLVSDLANQFRIPNNVRLYRTSLYKSQITKNEFLLPYIWTHNKSFSPLKNTELPIVGFCGWASKYRIKTLKLFYQNKNIKTNYILRNKFKGGTAEDFDNNMMNSHFNICNRGDGNFSMRFYETLNAGRIPILLNTNMILPLEEEIDWNDIIIFSNTEEELVKKLLDYCKTKDIIEMQIKCKEIFENYFSKTIFLDRVLSQ